MSATFSFVKEDIKRTIKAKKRLAAQLHRVGKLLQSAEILQEVARLELGISEP